MSLKATVRQAGNVSIVDLSGRITLGEGSGLVRSTIKDLTAAGHLNLLLNLKDVNYIDSAGLGELVGAYATVTNMGGRIKLLNAQSKVTDLLQVTKLYTVFSAFSDEGEALRSFATTAGGA
ncbi:MAG TPA: STAS domain-containing protein [Bryobacteraceae bacterium]|nr:STAS domain-containing protein [Bryobacteraceae bacterium]